MSQADLSTERQAHVRAGTFEVVIPKAEEESATYEKPLPMELLPYEYRNDKYISVGTAFAIGPHRYATAAHVIVPFINSQMGQPAVRDAAKHVYAIDEIIKFSLDEDFVVFSLKDEPQVQPLEAGAHPALQDTVYAVGNAFGEGVVIRDGAYTSETPEQRDGRWKWLRFSAAASPGNSGGPLVNDQGKVVGIVLAKSPTENLNYAVSIDQVMNAKEGVGLVRMRSTYQFDIFDEHDIADLDEHLGLPLGFEKFAKKLGGILDDFSDVQLKRLLQKNADSIFPQGDGARRLLDSTQHNTFPTLIVRKPDGEWEGQIPQKKEMSRLPNNAFVSHGNLRHQLMVHIRRPDDVPAKDFYKDSSIGMQMMLKAEPLTRVVGSEKIRLTSLGKAKEDSGFTDSYGRHWRMREWTLKFMDTRLVQLWLPVPDGAIVVSRLAPMILYHSEVIDLKALADFVSVSYGGTLEQWRDFLNAPVDLPDDLAAVKLRLKEGESVSFESKRFSLVVPADIVPIGPKTWIQLNTAYVPAKKKVEEGIVSALVKENEDSKNGVAALRLHAPLETTDAMQVTWKKISHHEHPFDGAIQVKDDQTFVDRVVDPAGGGTDPEVPWYVVSVEREGSVAQDKIAPKLDRLAAGFKVLEK